MHGFQSRPYHERGTDGEVKWADGEAPRITLTFVRVLVKCRDDQLTNPIGVKWADGEAPRITLTFVQVLARCQDDQLKNRISWFDFVHDNENVAVGFIICAEIPFIRSRNLLVDRR